MPLVSCIVTIIAAETPRRDTLKLVMFKDTAEESGCSTILGLGSMKANHHYGNPLLNPLRTVGS